MKKILVIIMMLIASSSIMAKEIIKYGKYVPEMELPLKYLEFKKNGKVISFWNEGKQPQTKYTIKNNNIVLKEKGETLKFEIVDNKTIKLKLEKLDIIFKYSKDEKKKSKGIIKLKFGKYIPDRELLIKSIEFKDNGLCYSVGSIMGIKSASIYKRSKNILIVTDNRGFVIPFEIIDSKTLKCESPFLNATYKLEE